MNEFGIITISTLIGLIIGYQCAKWKYYGKIDLLLWKVKKNIKTKRKKK